MRPVFWALLAVTALPDADSSVRYGELIGGLDPAAPESVCQARTTLRASMPEAGAGDRAAMFRSFRAFYLKAVLFTGRRLTEASKPFAPEIQGWFAGGGSPETVRKRIESRPDMRQAMAPWFDCGFSLTEGEGDLYPAQDSQTLLEFVKQLPPDLASYIRFRAREDAEDFVGDAAISISWERLGDRLARWETFGKRYPRLPETSSEVVAELHRLAWFCFLGIDNTRIYDLSTFRITPDVIASWRRLAAVYRNSRYRPLATELLSRIKAHDGRFTAEDRALFERFGLGVEFGQFFVTYQFRQQHSPR